jgi:cell fate regulator YaaT (PSP1 superfamily)
LKQTDNGASESSSAGSSGVKSKRGGRRSFRNYKEKKTNYRDSSDSGVKSGQKNSAQMEKSSFAVSTEKFRVNKEETDFSDEQAFQENELFETAAVWTWRPTVDKSSGKEVEDENDGSSVFVTGEAVSPDFKTDVSAVDDSASTLDGNVDSAGVLPEADEDFIYGISLRNRRGIFSCRDSRVFTAGENLIVKTSRGREFAVLCNVGLKVEIKREGDLYVQKIIRQANDDDIKNEQKNREKEQKSCAVAERKIVLLKLKMRIVETEYLFDGSRIIFYFVSPQKVDFRELVKILATEFRTRIELRQINPREYVGMKGAIAPCGQICCCSRFLSKAQPVDINMADNQRLGKNPVKLNGVCGRLKCCLRYENSFYTEAYAAVPPRNTCLVCANGKKGTVCGSSVFHDFVTVRWEDGGSANLSFAEVKAARVADTNSTKKD